MAELTVPDPFRASDVGEWFAQWLQLGKATELAIVFPEAPTSAVTDVVAQPGFLVLLAAGFAGRRAAGLSHPQVLNRDGSPLPAIATRLNTGAWEALSDESFGLWHSLRDLSRARALADRAAELLERQMPSLGPSAVRMARFVLEELGANVVQHSGFPETGAGAAKADPERKRLQLAFADAGVGIRESLQRNPEMRGRVADDAEALQLAVTPRVTGSLAPRKNMGIGLKLLLDFSDLLGGDLYIASGGAMLVRRTTVGQRTNVVRSIPCWQGTWIYLDAASLA